MKVMAIYGPPGTGKTTELVEIARDQSRDGQTILFLSFTKSAAAEAISRLPVNPGIQASTIHSLAFRALDLNRQSVVDGPKLLQFAEMTGVPFKGSEEGSEDPQEGDDYLQVYSFAQNRTCSLDYAYDHFGCPGTLARFMAFADDYANWKREYGYRDFDDMLMQFLTLRDRPYAKCIILDEAQDCSPLQWMVFEKIVRECETVFIAGDDDQAIYEWNGADPHAMRMFANTYHAEVSILPQSYRVPRRHHVKAMNIINQIGDRVRKEFAPAPRDGAISKYGDMTNVDLVEFHNVGGGLILTRDRWRQQDVKRALNRALIPYEVIGGFSPWTSKTATQLRSGVPFSQVNVPIAWRNFYRQADLTLPIDVKVSTIHQAKGREDHRVLVDLSLSAKSLLEIAHDEAAERRIQYVALTRAKEDLILCGSNPIVK
jgi:superfamily I DNA/RNA helicase